MIADIEELEEMDASELHARRLTAKEVLTPMKGDTFIFPVADGTIKISVGDQNLSNHPPKSGIVLNEGKNKVIFKENQTDFTLQLNTR